MYFVFESFHRRPLEARVLTYTRISVAVIFTVLFFVYCGYLVSQIKYDNPLLRLSTEHFKDEYELPHIEVCAQGTTMTFARCDLMYMNWSMISIPDCYKYIRFGDFSTADPSRCYLIESNGTIHYGVKDPTLYPLNATQIRRIDVYWRMDSTQNYSLASLGIPAVSIMLYDTSFSRWNKVPNNMIPQQAIFENEMAQGNYRSTSMQNHTSTIFFTPLKYRAIPPDDTGSLMGFSPSFVDIQTITATQLDWPMHTADNPGILDGVYHGLFSVQLAKTTYEVQTEQRQHTLLSAVALVGGAYGVMITLYTLMFGMVRHSPWGLAHQLPLSLIRGYDKVQNYRSRGSARNDGSEDNNSTGNSTTTRASAWKTLTPSTPPQDQGLSGGGGADEEGAHPSDATSKLMTEAPPPMTMAHDTSPKLRSTGYQHDNNALSMDRLNHLQNLCERLIEEQEQNHRRSTQLEDRLVEMQEVLREYYINMDYLDRVRDMRRRRPLRSWTGRSNARMSTNTMGGWLLDGHDVDTHHHQHQHQHQQRP